MRSKNRLAFLLSCAIVVATVPLLSLPVRAQSRPYTYKGGFNPNLPNQFQWNNAFPIVCRVGSEQSPFDIDTSREIRAALPKLTFHYNVASITYLDHYDQLVINHGAGNYITIGSQRFNLQDIHFHTPGEYTVNGSDPYPLEFHLVHFNADPKGLPQVAGLGCSSTRERRTAGSSSFRAGTIRRR